MRKIILTIEIISLVIIEIFYIRKYGYGSRELEISYPNHVALGIFSIAMILRFIVENITFVVFALSLEFFITVFIEKKRLQGIKLGRTDKLMIGWIIYLFTIDFFKRNTRLILSTIANFFRVNEAEWHEVSVFNFSFKYLLDPLADIMIVTTLSYLFYHQF